MAAMGTLYVVGAPASGPDDVTIRARRILGSVALVAAGDEPVARDLLASLQIATPVTPAARHDTVLHALARGDVALLLSGRSPTPGVDEQSLVGAALAGSFAVVPVPGPVLPLTALILSGLPGDSFVYLGALPREPAARRALGGSLADEVRTLVLLVAPGELLDLVALLLGAWGDRPIALWPASPGAAEGAWRGNLDQVLAAGQSLAGQEWVLVAGGAPQERGRPWDEDRLRGEIRACLEQGMGVGQASRELAAPSGWARREVYRLSVEEHERMSE